MSFLNITNPAKRDAIIADYLATIKRIKTRNLQERAKDFTHHEAIEQSLQPVIRSTAASTEALTKELVPIKEGITAINARLGQQQQQRQQQQQQRQQQQQQQQQQQEQQAVEEGKQETAEESKQKFFEELRANIGWDKLDEYFSIVQLDDGRYQMGSEIVQVDNEDIVVGGTRYRGTTGLWALVMLKKPDEHQYTIDDLHTYKRLVEQTNAMTAPNNVRPNSKFKTTYKWRNIFKMFETKEGHGIEFLPADINSLQTKLAYLLGEFQAGNSSATRNEIVAIVDNLLGRNRLSRSEYRRINDFIQQQQ